MAGHDWELIWAEYGHPAEAEVHRCRRCSAHRRREFGASSVFWRPGGDLFSAEIPCQEVSDARP